MRCLWSFNRKGIRLSTVFAYFGSLGIGGGTTSEPLADESNMDTGGNAGFARRAEAIGCRLSVASIQGFGAPARKTKYRSAASAV